MSLEKGELLYLRIGLGVEASSSGLAESHRNGRVSPNERLRLGNRELTFAEAVCEDAVLRNLVGKLPEEQKKERPRTWRAERRFRQEAWRRVVREGDLSLLPYLDRIEQRERDVRAAEERAAMTGKRLLAKTMEAERMATVLENGAENLESFSLVLARTADRRNGDGDADPETASGLRVLSGLVGDLAARFRSGSVPPKRRSGASDVRRIDEIEEFRKASVAEIAEARRSQRAEEARISEYRTKVLSVIEAEKATARRMLRDASDSALESIRKSIRHCERQQAIAGRFIGTIDNLVSLHLPNTAPRVRLRASMPRIDAVKALAAFAPSVSFDRVLALYDGSWFGHLDAGILLAPDGIHLSNGASPSFLPWSEDIELSFEGAFFAKTIRFGERIVGRLPHAPADSIAIFLSSVNAIAKSLPEPAFVREGLEAIATVAETVFDSPAVGEA